MSDVLLLASARALAQRIRSGETTSVAVVEAHIARLRQANPHLNAVVCERVADARWEAARCDERLARAKRDGTLNDLPPLLGVPCTIKESFHVVGMPNTAGLVDRVPLRVAEDAEAVARLRDAGAIILGVTNTSEVCMWMESYNRVYGLSRNPYDLARTVGGSSGGEGAIVGSGASPFGLGSDVGGSIRMPATFNGVFGHKPSPGLVPNEGQFPAPTGQIDRYLSTGPLCRRAEDLELLMRVLAGDQAHRLAPVAAVRIDRLRVFTCARELAIQPDADQSRAIQRSAQALVAAGATPRVLHLPLMAKARDLWTAMLACAETERTFADHLFGSRALTPPVKELLRLAVGRSQHTFPLVVLALAERIPEWTPRRTQQLAAQARQLKQQLLDQLGDDGVLLTPVYPTVAPRHHQALLPPFNFVNCALYNALSMPATAIPCGLNDAGLPTGIQAVAAEGHDALTLAVAVHLESALGGWQYPVLA